MVKLGGPGVTATESDEEADHHLLYIINNGLSASPPNTTSFCYSICPAQVYSTSLKCAQEEGDMLLPTIATNISLVALK